MNKWTLVVLLATGSRLEANPVEQETDGLSWVQPSPVPPVATGRAVRGALPNGLLAPEVSTNELAGLRAVSLREGHGTIALRGTTRAIRCGDRLGSVLVKAVGSDRIILERPAQPGGPQGQAAQGPATIVVTFGPGGEARVRTYALATATAPPPEVR